MMFSDIVWNLVCCKEIRFSKRKVGGLTRAVHCKQKKALPSELEDFAPASSRQRQKMSENYASNLQSI